LKGKGTGLDFGNILADHEIPIVFITQFEDLETYNLTKEIPNSNFIVKPFYVLTLK